MSIQPGVETRSFHSRVLDQDLLLFIKLPWTYEKDDKTYPVLFTLDANRHFLIFSTTSLIFETPGLNTQEIVIVGIGYQLDNDRTRGFSQYGLWRTRDLTPIRREEIEQYWSTHPALILPGENAAVKTGGAHQFLEAIQKEIIPFIEADYRVQSNERGLAGYSYGGLFTLYTLFSAPEIFSRYFAGSPSMWDVLFEYEKNYASTHQDLPVKLFMTAGGREKETCKGIKKMVERLHSRSYPGLEVITHFFAGEGHMSGAAAAFSRALSVLYYPEILAIKSA
jgi:predicted alpha/beta superfamily hydrolase